MQHAYLSINYLLNSFKFFSFLQPILRDAFEKNPSMSLDQARQVVTNCLRVLFYRDARSLNKVCSLFIHTSSFMLPIVWKCGSEVVIVGISIGCLIGTEGRWMEARSLTNTVNLTGSLYCFISLGKKDYSSLCLFRLSGINGHWLTVSESLQITL